MNFGAFHIPTALVVVLVLVGGFVVVKYLLKKI